MLNIIEASPKEIGETLSLGGFDNDIFEKVMQHGTVYCIKNCLNPDAIDSLRKNIADYYAPIPQTKISYDGPTMHQNYHSIEKGVSQIQKTLHYFHAYVFNAIEDLPPSLKPQVKGLFHSLVSFYNAITSQNRPLTGMHSDGKQFRPQIFQYPVGGGMFTAHAHALEPQKLGLILGLSKRGRDFHEGGAGFELPDKTLIDTSAVQDIGDIVIFRYDLKHWVAPCDIHKPLDDSKSNGRWSAVIPIY